MGILLAFAPFIAFAVVDRVIGSVEGLVVGALVSATLLVRDWLSCNRPFTLQYARKETAPEIWDSPEFIRTNYVITAAWTAAFAVIVAADFLMLYAPDVPLSVGIVATVLALVAAVKFTVWYPERRPNEAKT